jgi:hypothetical protein
MSPKLSLKRFNPLRARRLAQLTKERASPERKRLLRDIALLGKDVVRAKRGIEKYPNSKRRIDVAAIEADTLLRMVQTRNRLRQRRGLI